MKSFSMTFSNGDLSRVELIAVLGRLDVPFGIKSHEQSFCKIEAEELPEITKVLGGSFKIGEVLVEAADERAFLESLSDAKVIDWVEEKASWSLSFYGIKNGIDADFVQEVQSLVAQKIREAGGLKAKRVLPDITDIREGVKEVSSGLVTERRVIDFQLIKFRDSYSLALTTSCVPSHEFYQRDLGRPFQDPTISLSPRVARILVNLTGVGEGQSLLDPFCGTGTILMEAAVMGINIIGFDSDLRKVKGAIENINWLRRSGKVSNHASLLKRGDARELHHILGKNSVDGIATEPILLPVLERFPSEEEAREMLMPSFKTYTKALASMEVVLKRGGKIALVVPYIRLSNRKKAGFDTASLLESSRLKLAHIEGFSFPVIARYTPDQKVIRGVLLLEKP